MVLSLCDTDSELCFNYPVSASRGRYRQVFDIHSMVKSMWTQLAVFHGFDSGLPFRFRLILKLPHTVIDLDMVYRHHNIGMFHSCIITYMIKDGSSSTYNPKR